MSQVIDFSNYNLKQAIPLTPPSQMEIPSTRHHLESFHAEKILFSIREVANSTLMEIESPFNSICLSIEKQIRKQNEIN